MIAQLTQVGRALIIVAAAVIALAGSMGRGFSLSPFVVFAAFAFWIWLIGPAGALLAVALTQLLVLVLESFPETRGIAGLLKRATATQPAADPEALDVVSIDAAGINRQIATKKDGNAVGCPTFARSE